MPTAHPPTLSNNIMSTMVAVITIVLPCVLLVEPPSAVYNRGRLSVVSDVTAPLILIPAKKEIPHPVNQHDDRRLEDTRTLYLIHNGPNHSQIYNSDRSSAHIDSLESKKNISDNLQNTIYDMNDKDLEEIENPNEGNGWTTLFKPEQTLISNLTFSSEKEVLDSPSKYDEDGNDSLNRQVDRFPPLNTYFAPSIGTYFGTGPLILPNGEMSVLVESGSANSPAPNTNPQVPNMNPEVIILPESSPNIISPETSNILSVQIPTPSSQQLVNLNWQRVGLLLAFMKLGLIKLKSVGFIKILLVFLFKLKLFLLLVSFKIISIFNMLLFSKFVMLPLFILPLLPIIVTIISPKFMVGLLSIPGKIIKYNTVLGPADLGKVTPTSTNATETNSSVSDLSSPLN